jgi:methylated-DNA-[protein]-cysteine S-methyltransferase/AraC family transcriptional regulator of adaptative response/methylated-DNA-[protein]-cysteine methyltransferase
MKTEQGATTMNLMNTRDALQMTPQVKAAVAAADVLFYAVADCELGKVMVARSAKGVCSILLGDSAEELTADLASRFQQAMLIPSETAVEDDLGKVLRYIEKPARGLDLTLDIRGTPFQRRVWEKLKAISAGRTVSYMELARWLSPLANPRAVARACATNPIALAIPCHRVVSSNGDLAGYRWGIERKRALIQKEATI